MVKDDEGYKISVSRRRGEGVKVSHPNQGWFKLDRENARALATKLLRLTDFEHTKPKDPTPGGE